MLDFVSTREGVHPSTKASAQLVAAVIVRMLRDACVKPTASEKKAAGNLNLDAIDALDYLFGERSSFEDHIDAIGGAACSFRTALLGDHPLREGAFDIIDRRTLQLRHRWWRSIPVPRIRPQLTKELA